MRRINQESWMANFNHHIQQFTKGVLVSLFTFAGYGLAKRLLGDTTKIQTADSQDQALTASSHKSSAEVAFIMPQSASLSSFLKSETQHNIHKSQEAFLADELEVSFHEKETKPPLTTHRINDTPDPEDMTIIIGEEFRKQIPGYLLSDDGKTYYFGNMTATLADGSPLPKWIYLEPPPKPFSPAIIGTIKTIAVIDGIALQKDLALLAADLNGLQIVNIGDPRHPKQIGSQAFSGEAQCVTVQKDMALVAAGDYLQLVNVSDPRQPKLIECQPLPNQAWSVAVQGDVALIGAGEYLRLVNVSDPRQPKPIGSRRLPDLALSITVQGDVAYVAVDDAGFQLVNIRDPRDPKLMGRLPGKAVSVAVQGNLALLAAQNAGLQLVNVSDPQHPKLIGSQSLLGDTVDVAVGGDWALVATRSEGLQIVNIMQPTTPRIVAQIKTDSDVNRVAVQGNLAFVGCQNSFKIIDLKAWAWTLRGKPPLTQSSLSTTILIQARSLLGVSYQKTLRLYSSSRPIINKPIRGMSVRPGQSLSYRFAREFLDSTDHIVPFMRLEFGQEGNHALPDWLSVSYEPMVGSLPLSKTAFSVAVQGSVVYVAADIAGLQLVNVSDPYHPKFIVSQALPGNAYGVVVQGDLALVAANFAGLQLVNVSDPRHPKPIRSQPLPGNAMGVALKADVALVASSKGGDLKSGDLQLVDVSNPRDSKLIGGQSLPGGARGVAVKGDMALVADNAGLQLVDVSDSRHPKHIGSQPLPYALSVVVQRDLALLVNEIVLQLVNVSNPSDPKSIGSQRFPGGVRNVALQGNVVLVAADFSGLHLINIHRPQQPVWMDSIGTMGNAKCVTVRDNIAFVGTSNGLNIIQYGLSGVVLRGQPSKTDHKNYQIFIRATNADGIVANTTFRISVNNPPVWNTSITQKIVNVGQVVSFQLAEDVFWDEDGDVLAFTSKLSNGNPLPNWIVFFAEGQIYSIIPSSNNRDTYNISVIVDDGYYGTARAWFLLIVPTRKPDKKSEIASQNAFIWRSFELLVSDIFTSPDGDGLVYRAQLKGARPLPGWLHFDNTTCLRSCHFTGNPGITDLTDLEVELIAKGLGGEASVEFSIAMRASTLFQDLATYYSVSGAGIVILSLLVRTWRWKKMREIAETLTQAHTSEVTDVIRDVSAESIIEMKRQDVEAPLQTLLNCVERRQIQALPQNVQQYNQRAVKYAKQHQCTVLEVGYPWEAIKKIGLEIEIRMMHKLNYQDTSTWVEALHQLLQIIIETEFGHGRAVLKTDKEQLLSMLDKAEKYIEIKKKNGIKIKHQLELCREALVSLDDTDSIKDNLCCRDSEMLLETIKTMIAPPYGIVRLMYQYGNIPSGWYPIIIQMCRLADQALTNSERLSELQTTLSQQKDWRVVYEGVGLLGKVARETEDEKIQKQAVEGVRDQTRGLNYYQNYRGFWGRCSSCCDKQSAWIRAHAQAEVKSIDQGAQEVDAGVSMNLLRQPLLQIQA